MIKRRNFNALIEKVKIYAKKNPAAYKQRVVLLGVLGYAYILMVLILLLTLIGGSGWLLFHVRGGKAALFKLIIFLLILAGMIIKSLWVKTESPQGIPLTKEKAPKLFAIIKDICAKQKSPLPHAVLLNSDFNAFISQVPRLGILGWYKNYLVLGLPYMMAGDLDQFKAVMAHEFGHFSGSHGKTGTWIYRIRASWYNIVTNFDQKAGNFIFNWFFDWYVPYFNAYSFVLAREQEYEADRYATAYAGAQANAEELVNAVIKGSASGPYWENVWRHITTAPLPPTNAFTQAVMNFKQPVPEEQYRDDLYRALKIRTQNLDTHPCLKERLAALGYTALEGRIVDAKGNTLTCQKNITVSAAHDLLNEQTIQESLNQFDREWYKSVEEKWKERHAEIQKMKKDLADLNAKTQIATLNEEQLTQRAYLIDQTSSREEAVAAITEVLQRYPTSAPAHYRLGELLVAKNDDKGVEHLKKAMQLDAGFSSSCLEKISWYHESRGEYEQVESALDNLEVSSEKDKQDYIERNNVTAKDHFKEHGLGTDEIEDLGRQLEPFAKELNEVYLIQKEMKVYPQEPMYVLAVRGRMSIKQQFDASGFNQKLVQKLLPAIQLKITRGTAYFVVGDPHVNKKVKKITGALVYRRK